MIPRARRRGRARHRAPPPPTRRAAQDRTPGAHPPDPAPAIRSGRRPAGRESRRRVADRRHPRRVVERRRLEPDHPRIRAA